jgi:hypothetical protein
MNFSVNPQITNFTEYTYWQLLSSPENTDNCYPVQKHLLTPIIQSRTHLLTTVIQSET